MLRGFRAPRKDDSVRPEPIYPFSDSNDIFRVYELPKRTAASGCRVHSWAYGIRLGPKASGAWANYVSDVTQPKLPPVLRKINWRELVTILQTPNQIGLPTSLNTDSQLGWSVYSYMSPEVLFDICEGDRSILLKIDGYCSKGHSASGEAQRAKVGLRPCCAVATHVFVPPVYSVGRPDRKKNNSTALWQRYGPMATRGYTAAVYFNANGELPASWDWVATKHRLTLPCALNEAYRREGVSRDDHEDRASVATGGTPVRRPKPPPPVHPSVASPGPSSAVSHGLPSQSSSSWERGWNTQQWEPKSRRWRSGKY